MEDTRIAGADTPRSIGSSSERLASQDDSALLIVQNAADGISFIVAAFF